MQLEEEKFEMKSDGFLPRHKNMICHHSVGNKLFGIKFKVSPVLFEKKINFSEYREYIFPLSYLIDKTILEKIKSLSTFQDRIALLNNYYEKLIMDAPQEIKKVKVVTECIRYYTEQGNFNLSLSELAERNSISSKTLQRYFMEATSISG